MSPQEHHARIVNNWVLVHNQSTNFDMDKDRYGVDVDYFIGFVYIDSQAGMTIDMLSYCTVDGNTITMTKGPRDDNSSMKVRYTGNFMEQLKCTILSDEQRNTLSLPVEPDWLHFYHVEGQEEIERIRKLELLHPLRAPGFPDDIRFALIPMKQGMQVEQVWGKIMANPQENIFIVRLLNQPNQDFNGIKMGDFLAVEVKAVEQGLSSVCIGKVDVK